MKLTSIIANKCNFYKLGGPWWQNTVYNLCHCAKNMFLKDVFSFEMLFFVLWCHFATLSCVEANSGISLDAVLLTYADI